MPEQIKQKSNKPNIEDIAAERLDGKHLANLLDFLDFLKANKLKLRWHSTDSWAVRYKNKWVCWLILKNDEPLWFFRPNHIFHKAHLHVSHEKYAFIEYNRYITDDDVKKLVWDNLQFEKRCEKDCNGFQNREIVGKVFDRICACWPITITAPEGAALECSKKLTLVIKTIISDL